MSRALRGVFAVILIAGLAACGGSSGTKGKDTGKDAGKDIPTVFPDSGNESVEDVPDTGTNPDEGRPDEGQPDPGQPDPGQPDPGQHDPGQPDPGQPDPGQPDPGKTDEGQPDIGNPDIPVYECEKDADCAAKLPNLGPCQEGVCVQATRTCVARSKTDASSCDDSNACTKGDYCSNGVCKGKPVVCDDGNVCTDDDCDPDSGCKHVDNANPCEDGNDCTENDACAAGKCTSGKNTCQCQEDKECKPFEDSDLCNGTLVCKDKNCAVDPATVKTCDTTGDNACKVTACNPATGECEAETTPDGKSCDDGDACTDGDTCTAGLCVGGAKVTCDDQNPCTDDACDPKAKCVYTPNTAACDDNDKCTDGDVCANGVCQPGKLTCATTCQPAMSLFCDVTHKFNNGGEKSTNVAANYACNENDTYDGPEYTYTFVAPYDGTFTVTLADESAETDVLVLEAGDGCDPAKCVAWAYTQVSFEATAYKTYYLVVDGYDLAVGDYTVHVSCTPATELYCDDGIDNDKDGKTDCDDTDDCAGKTGCPLPQCVPDYSLGCGDKDTWYSYSWGSTDQVDAYSCSAMLMSGPEYAYRFHSDTEQKVTVKLTYETGDTSIFVLDGGTDGSCDPFTCIDFGKTQSTFKAAKDKDYFFVVDGYADSQGKYTVQVTCSPLTEDICDDGKDNEGDGATDCDDEDCLGTTDCPTCDWAYVLACGDTDSWNNGDFGSTTVVGSYKCNDYPYDGPEYTYVFIPDADQTVTIELSDETADTDILVLEDSGAQVCNPKTCIADDMEKVTFEAKAGKRYYIVVDGYSDEDTAGTTGDYTITVNCL